MSLKTILITVFAASLAGCTVSVKRDTDVQSKAECQELGGYWFKSVLTPSGFQCIIPGVSQ